MEDSLSVPLMYADTIYEHLDYLVYDEKYELDPANIKLLQTLGSGHFGDVYLGILNLNGAKIPVAVKKMKQLASIQQTEGNKGPEECNRIWQIERDSLRDELKIMAHIGVHSNVVRLIGAVTTSKDDYCLATEYCEYGSLDTFLQNKMDHGLFMNEIVTEDSAGYVIRGRECVYKNMQDTSWDSQFEIRRSKGMLTTSDLLWFALQMARAMEYLTQHSVVHRDVALRNVLLKSDYTLKVADFGLSRLASDDGCYYQLRNVAVPIRSTAPEAMKVGRFSEHSECWAYGVALWELFTFSKKQPYSEECPDGYNDIMAFLTAGNRLTVPSTAPKPIRLMILKLWNEYPTERPSFSVCQSEISKELSLSCPQILVRMHLDYDMLPLKKTSSDDVKIVQNLHDYLQKREKTSAKNIYPGLVPRRQSRVERIAWCAALVTFVILALISIGITGFKLNCGNQALDMGKMTAHIPNVTWTTNEGHILLNGKQLVLKGINYYGFETESSPHGASSQSLDIMLDFMEENDFNAVRLSFSIEMIQKNPKTNVDCKSNEDICRLRALELMEAVIDRCADRGILVVLVCTQLSSSSSYIERNGLWYDDEIQSYTEEKVLEAWDVLMNLVKKKWNLLALDALEQPRKTVSWGTSSTDRDFNQYTERFVKHISSKHAEFTGFFFVQGIDKNGAFQGEDLMGVRDNPIATGNMEYDKRIIYSPHSFGPDVHLQPYFTAPNFPKNMPSIWEKFYGFIATKKANPVIVGSWGGKYQNGTLDETWHNAFASWLQDKCLANQFYFCLNGPNDPQYGEPLLSYSGIPNRRKLELLNELQPHPTRLRYIASTSLVAL